MRAIRYLVPILALVLAAISITLALNTQAGEHPAAPAQEYQHGFYGGLGFSDSDGSGSIQAEQMVDDWKLFAQIWTDNDEDGDQFVVQERRTKPKSANILVLQGGDSDTANVALGGAYCLTFEQYIRGCGGVAYLTDDDTDNVDDHLAVYWELGATLPKAPKWRAFLAGYGDDEAFIMGGRRF